MKILKLKETPDGVVIHPTYEEMIEKINEIILFTDERTASRDLQIENLKKEIHSLRREIMQLHNLFFKEKATLDDFNGIIKQASSLYLTLANDMVKVKKKLEIRT